MLNIRVYMVTVSLKIFVYKKKVCLNSIRLKNYVYILDGAEILIIHNMFLALPHILAMLNLPGDLSWYFKFQEQPEVDTSYVCSVDSNLIFCQENLNEYSCKFFELTNFTILPKVSQSFWWNIFPNTFYYVTSIFSQWMTYWALQSLNA